MPIQLYSSHNLHQLSVQLAKDLKQKTNGVFWRQHIVTQTDGVNNWLKLRIAEEQGIAANLQFNKPNDLVQQIHFWLNGQKRTALNFDFVQWNLFYLLDGTDFKLQFPDIAGYYHENELNRIALAGKLSDLFDQYQVYRPEEINRWNQLSKGDEEKDNWQQWLWIRIREIMMNRMQDKTEQVHEILAALASPEKQEMLKRKIPLLCFFGIAVITPFYMQLFNKLGEFIDIHFYLINPSPEQYWLEDSSEEQIARLTRNGNRTKIPGNIGNSLLLNWGKIIKDSFYLLFQDEEVINSMEILSVRKNSEKLSLLQKIQTDIFLNADPQNRLTVFQEDLKDGSLTINSCYTPVRETEVLYNYLVSLIDQKKEKLSPRDIVVMVSDIDRYAPYIRAVFDNAPYEFPYTIADETISSGNNLFSALLEILSFDPVGFKAEAVLELLESPYIRNRFGISQTDNIRNLMQLIGIRFGWEGSREDDTRYFSWTYGFDRMLLGLCMSGGGLYDTGDDMVELLDAVEGQSGLQLIRFRHFVEVLHHYLSERDQSRTLKEWVEYIQLLVDDLLFESGEADDEDFHRLISYLEKIVLLELETGTPVPFEVFLHSFTDAISLEKRSQSFTTGGITFCSLIPMRSIPFKVIALMGMDFDKFPRKETRLSFSLLEKEQKRGDRNVKDNDKHLFLESVIAAQQYLYISYLGNSTKDNTEKPPSSLVDELLEYVVSGVRDIEKPKRDTLITRHPLHGFSQRYFNGSGLISYLSDEKYRSETPSESSAVKMLPRFEGDIISIHDLSNFFKDPFKWYLNKALNIYYRDEQTLLPETETFELDGLDEWMIRDALVSIPEKEYDHWREHRMRAGLLPLGNIGRIAIEKQAAVVAEFKQRVNEITKGLAPRPIDVMVDLGKYSIEGRIENIYEHKFVFVTTSSKITKALATAFVQYVAAIASGHSLEFILISSQKTFHIHQDLLTTPKAQKLMLGFTDQYIQGFTECFPFYPDLVALPGMIDILNRNYEDFKAEIQDRFNQNGRSTESMVNNQYFLRIYESGQMNENWYRHYQTVMKRFFETINEYIPNLFEK
jgi:exodeoxyribonuclease V gamma subunit